MSLALIVNGAGRELPQLESPAELSHVIAALALHEGRVAVEHNGQIVPRSRWPTVGVRDGDRLEVVHFVGGGSDSAQET